MRLVGSSTYDANVTTTYNSLDYHLMLQPEIMTNVVQLFEGNFTNFLSFLGRNGMSVSGLSAGMSNDRYTVIGNRKVKWALEGFSLRKGHITTDVAPAAGYANIGENGSVFSISLDTNFFSKYDQLELVDRRTYIILLSEPVKSTATDEWTYQARLVTNRPGAFVNANLLLAGTEVGFLQTSFPEMSETGYEKNTFPEWHIETMTIQRMKFSISGSAAATVMWVSHNGQNLWTTRQRLKMLERWAIALENQMIFGVATQDANDNVALQDLEGRDIVAGNGIVAQGDRSLKFAYNRLSARFLENVMQQMQLYKTGDGMLRIAVGGGQAFIWDFQRLMREVFGQNPKPLFSDANGRGVNSTFTWYEMGGVRLETMWIPAFDAQWRPQHKDMHGTSFESYRGFFVSLGNTIGGDPNIELIALGNGQQDRRFVEKTVTGMVDVGQGTDRVAMQASNSMDAAQVHILSECGICMKNPFGFAEVYRPVQF